MSKRKTVYVVFYRPTGGEYRMSGIYSNRNKAYNSLLHVPGYSGQTIMEGTGTIVHELHFEHGIWWTEKQEVM